MKFIFFIALCSVCFAASTYKPSAKESSLYCGHSEYRSGKYETCIIRLIEATSKKQADSLFRSLTDSILKKDNGSLSPGSYDVWEVKPSMYLKVNHDSTNRNY